MNTPALDEIAFDIAMALRDAALFDGRRRRLSIDDKAILAKAIVDHLVRAGILFERKPPLIGHGTFGPRRT